MNNCRRCDRAIHPKDRPDLPGLQSPGRRLCATCYRVARANGTLNQYERLPAAGGPNGGRPVGTVAEDFQWFVEQHGGIRAANRMGWSTRTRRLAAERLGLSLGTLDRALYRHLDRIAA